MRNNILPPITYKACRTCGWYRENGFNWNDKPGTCLIGVGKHKAPDDSCEEHRFYMDKRFNWMRRRNAVIV